MAAAEGDNAFDYGHGRRALACFGGRRKLIRRLTNQAGSGSKVGQFRGRDVLFLDQAGAALAV